MITVLIGKDEERIKAIVSELLDRIGNIKIDIVREGNVVKILQDDEIKKLVSLEEKVIELEEALYSENKGRLYKSILEVIERPLLEHILERTDGNQLKAARILGLNRNTIRAKIKKLGINTQIYKQ